MESPGHNLFTWTTGVSQTGFKPASLTFWASVLTITPLVQADVTPGGLSHLGTCLHYPPLVPPDPRPYPSRGVNWYPWSNIHEITCTWSNLA